MRPEPDLRVLVEAALARAPLPAALAREGAREEAVSALLRHGRGTETREGRAFFYQGDKAEAAYLLLEGRARQVKYKADGKSLELPILEAGDWLGLGELAIGAAHPCDILAECPCLSLAFPLYGFALASSLRSFACLVSRALARELLALHSYVEDEAPEQRILSFLLSRKKELAGIGNSRIAVTQEGIARAVGVTRETVNKKLKSLEDGGLINTLRGQIEVLDWEGLAERRNDGA